MKDVKSLYFIGDENEMEPVSSLHAVADGTMTTIGHLFGASLCNYGPAPNFLAPWVYRYIAGGIEAVLNELPLLLNTEHFLCQVYNMVLDFCY